ncbi:MAG: alternative ribosome rescue aminoacyl-tRNA hydrolase ArfB [Candidatus Tectomicrobia bacterium]|nr:alternative ribosome rescue aminoacyl-tRNA hydrolase ArfB [Candidatus Tectomicrobia bacterium]
MIHITDQLTIPEHELWFTTARSGGPGGQHVNKVNSRVTLWFDVVSSPSLSEIQKHSIRTRLATRVNRDGILRVVSQQHRSQTANRDTAIERFTALLRDALTEAPTRHKTRVTAAAKRRRLDEKKRRSQIKQRRTQRPDLGA